MEDLKSYARQDYYSMLYAWMSHTGPRIKCSDLHEHTTCKQEFFGKIMGVAKNNWGFYMVLHVLPFLLFKLKKMKDKSSTERLHMLFSLLKNYCGSILFMGTFVAIMKGGTCLYNRTNFFAESPGGWINVFGALASVSLIFEEKPRRVEIALFAFVRSFKTYYMYLNRRGLLNIPHIDKLCFVAIFAALSYLYHEHPQSLKHKSILDRIWGTA